MSTEQPIWRGDEPMPLFVTLDGPHGAGKTTVMKWLQGEFIHRFGQSRELVLTKEPYDRAGVFARVEACEGNPEGIAAVFEEDRQRHMVEVVLPALKRGAVVVSDRSRLSTAALQGKGDWLGYLQRAAPLPVEPDLQIVINAYPEQLAKRLHQREGGGIDPSRPTYDPSAQEEAARLANLTEQVERWAEIGSGAWSERWWDDDPVGVQVQRQVKGYPYGCWRSYLMADADRDDASKRLTREVVDAIVRVNRSVCIAVYEARARGIESLRHPALSWSAEKSLTAVP